MWVIAEYLSTALFSLRPCTATSSGGKSLIVPTPFALKMALLDAAIQSMGLGRGRELFPSIRDLRIAAQLPHHIAVNNTFARILRLNEIKTSAAEKDAAIANAINKQQWPFQRTIAFREYVQFGGPLLLAFDGMERDILAVLLSQVSYLGKRGGFMQLTGPPVTVDVIGTDFTVLTESIRDAFPLGVLQVLDDCGADMTFEHANVYTGKRIRLGNERVLRQVVLPFEVARSSKRYTLYARVER